MPEISVIVPVYRAEKYLHQCVDSILSQTFSDFELFLVNDGSPDGCGAICDGYARKDSRIRVIHQENRGQAAARNHALAGAQGSWICFVDSDDLIHPQMLQRLYEGALAHEAGVSLCRMAESPEVPEDFYAQPDETVEVLDMNEQTLARLFDLGEYPSWVACAKLIRREYVCDRPFCEGRVYEDNEAVCHWVCRSPRLVRLQAPMYYYRTNPGSTTQRGFTLKKLDYMWALESIILFYGELGYREMKSRFSRLYTGEVINCCNGIRFELREPDRIGPLVKNARRFCRQQGIRFSPAEEEMLLEVMYPQWMGLYWNLKGAVCTLRDTGISGLVKKIAKRFGKEDDQ